MSEKKAAKKRNEEKTLAALAAMSDAEVCALQRSFAHAWVEIEPKLLSRALRYAPETHVRFQGQTSNRWEEYLVQLVGLRLWGAALRGKLDFVENFSGYAFTVLKNVFKDMYGQARHRAELWMGNFGTGACDAAHAQRDADGEAENVPDAY